MSVLQLALEHLKELSQPSVGVPVGRPLGVSHWDTCPEAKPDQPAVEIATKAIGGAAGQLERLGRLGHLGHLGHLERLGRLGHLGALPPPRSTRTGG
jgi:hypothetical protein